MHDACGMSVIQPERHGAADSTNVGDRERTQRASNAAQVEPFDVFHYQVVNILGLCDFRFTCIGRIDDGRMLQRAGRTHFAFESPSGFIAAERARCQYFDRNQLSQLPMPRQIDPTHTALPNRS